MRWMDFNLYTEYQSHEYSIYLFGIAFAIYPNPIYRVTIFHNYSGSKTMTEQTIFTWHHLSVDRAEPWEFLHNFLSNSNVMCCAWARARHFKNISDFVNGLAIMPIANMTTVLYIVVTCTAQLKRKKRKWSLNISTTEIKSSVCVIWL